MHGKVGNSIGGSREGSGKKLKIKGNDERVSRVLNSLATRRAIKAFEPGAIVDIKPVLDAIRFSPTSFGLQPFLVRNVTTGKLKRNLSPLAFDQPQIIQCSNLLIFSARTDSDTLVERYISATKMNKTNKAYLSIRASVSGKTELEMLNWARAQTYIALGYALTSAALNNIDCCPLEGFSSEGFREVLKLPSYEVPVVLLALGKAHQDPKKATPNPKFNIDRNDIIIDAFVPKAIESDEAESINSASSSTSGIG